LKRTLEMIFKKTDDKTAKLTVADPREDLTGDQVKTAMENIISQNIFLISGTELSAVHEAKIITVDEELLELD